MANSIHGLKRQYSLDESKVRRLETEYELISLRIDFCLYKYNTDRRNLYDLLVLYGGLEEFIQGIPIDKKKFLRNDIEIYNANIKSDSFNRIDKRKLMQILFFDSDYIRRICGGVDNVRYFDYDISNDKVAFLSFSNMTTLMNPFRDYELENRRDELKWIARHIRDNFPQIKYISSVSWMLELEAVKGIMPKKFIGSLQEFYGENIYDSKYWNQFILHNGNLDKSKIKEFKRTWKFPHSVLFGRCRIEEFYDMYLEEE